MCGITGFWQLSKLDGADRVIENMTDSLRHRGPDRSATWGDKGCGLWLGHRRLAIIDLSDAGAQPIHSHCGRFTLVYNGELYNHLEVRSELEKAVNCEIPWRGHSDSETLIQACSHWGVRRTLKRINGMFAFALWDHLKKQLYLARDRLGEKPLYYGVSNGCLMFASEIRSLRAHPSFIPEINHSAILAYLESGSIPAPLSIYTGIAKLQPGDLAKFENPIDLPEIESYWRPHFCQNSSTSVNTSSSSGKLGQDKKTLNREVDVCEGYLEQAVSSRMIADVPVGAFLSGGYDSALVVAMMQKNTQKKTNTFTIGFDTAQFNEAPFAKSIASYLGTEHQEHYVTSSEALDIIPDLPEIWDEPFADPSQIPTYLVSRLASNTVKVVQSGDGGDELFGGYSRYQKCSDIWSKIDKIPAAIKPSAALLAEKLNELCHAGEGHDAKRLSDRVRFEMAHTARLLDLMSSQHIGTLYSKILNPAILDMNWLLRTSDTYSLGLGEVVNPDRLKSNYNSKAGALSHLNYMMGVDMAGYLPDTILTKVDRASMSVSLETRAPLLDHRLVEYSCSLNEKYKLADGEGKWLLRQVTRRYIPSSMLDREKTGFGIPLAEWLRGPLRDWASDLLNPNSIEKFGLFDPKRISKIWSEFLFSGFEHERLIWKLLMLQSWLVRSNE